MFKHVDQVNSQLITQSGLNHQKQNASRPKVGYQNGAGSMNRKQSRLAVSGLIGFVRALGRASLTGVSLAGVSFTGLSLAGLGLTGLGLTVSGLAASVVAPQVHAQNELPKFEDVIEGLVPVEPPRGESGMFSLWRQNPDDPKAGGNQLICRVPRGLLNQDLLFATTITAGQYAGYQWSDYLVRFRLQGSMLILEAPDTRYVAQSGTTVADPIQRTYQPTIVAALPIITMAGADPVVDLSKLLISNVVQAPISGRVSPALASYQTLKLFPDNVLLGVDLPYSVGDGQYESFGVAYAFRRLPSVGDYQPRRADERVGYFTTVRQDWAIKHTSRENLLRYINRWDLKKQDPALSLSPPQEPIKFIIEDTVPVQWRRWVRAGIEEWNKAFEEVGFSEAIVVYQQTQSNEFADIDAADARYNFISWIVSGRAFAMGPSRVDPRTGQILDADIIVDDSFLRYMMKDADLFSPAALASGLGPDMLTFLQENPGFLPVGETVPEADQQMQKWRDAALAARPHAVLTYEEDGDAVFEHEHSTCGCATSLALKHRAAMAQVMTLAGPGGKEIPEEVVGVMVKNLVMHEVGHTLGLRHNFKASSWLTLDEIKQRRGTDQPLTASVMDYLPDAFFDGDDFENDGLYLSNSVLGPYDYWAIAYGYTVPGGENGPEDQLLTQITSRSAEDGLAYATDEDTRGPASLDPYVNRWDLSSDAVAYAQSRIELANGLLENIEDWALTKDDTNDYLRKVFGTLMYEKNTAMPFVARFVSGQVFSRSRPADANAAAPLTLLDPSEPREALAFLGQTVFDDDYWQADAELYNKLPAPRWRDWASSAPVRIDFPVHKMILNHQARVLAVLMSPPALQRIYDAELKSTAEDKFTLAEMLQRTQEMIWDLSEVPGADLSDASPYLSSIRRNLQLQYLAVLENFADGGIYDLSPDVTMMIRYSLRDLGQTIQGVLDQAGSEIDFASKAHLVESQDRIQRLLSGVFVER